MKSIFNFSKASIFLFISLAFFSITSCHKEGEGGKSSISGMVKHHEQPIPNCVVYIKYGATEFPGTDVSKYDASVTADADANYAFSSLRKGDYYLYGVGYDNFISEIVTGGIAIKLKYNKAVSSNVPVTE